VLLEDVEGIGEETDLVPHAGTLQRDERQAFLGAHRFHLGGAIAPFGREHRTLEVRYLGGIDVQRNTVLPRGQDATRVQDFGPAGSDFLRLVVMEGAQQARIRRGARIRTEQAGHIGPDLEPPGRELGRQIGRGGVGAAATEEHRLAVLVTCDKSLRDEDRSSRLEPVA